MAKVINPASKAVDKITDDAKADLGKVSQFGSASEKKAVRKKAESKYGMQKVSK